VAATRAAIASALSSVARSRRSQVSQAVWGTARRRSALHARTRARGRGLEEEPPASAGLVERARHGEVCAAVQAPDAANARGGAEVVGTAGDAALLGAGDGEPDVAGRVSRLQSRREGREDADARGVVVRGRHAGERVGLSHEDRQAARRGVELADEVAGAAAAGHREALVRDAQAGSAESGGDVALGAQLAGAGSGRGPMLRLMWTAAA
jgi:hypothetical protein